MNNRNPQLGLLTMGPMIEVLKFCPYGTKLRFAQVNTKYAGSIDAHGNVTVGVANLPMVWEEQTLTLRFRCEICTLYQKQSNDTIQYTVKPFTTTDDATDITSTVNNLFTLLTRPIDAAARIKIVIDGNSRCPRNPGLLGEHDAGCNLSVWKCLTYIVDKLIQSKSITNAAKRNQILDVEIYDVCAGIPRQDLQQGEIPSIEPTIPSLGNGRDFFKIIYTSQYFRFGNLSLIHEMSEGELDERDLFFLK